MNDNTEDRELNPADGASDPNLGNEALQSVPQSALALDDDERLPWLESADDEDEDGGVDTARLVRFAVLGLAFLAAILGGVWFVNHRAGDAGQIAEGGVIPAPKEPYKTEPTDKGGKTFAGTGDSAFAVSEGKSAPAKLGGVESPVSAPSASAPAPAAAGSAPAGKPAAAKPAAASASAALGAATGIGVQVGAYSSQSTAEAGWSRLSSAHEALKGLKHRIVEGTADIGTVYRLQAVTADVASANALCANLKSGGVACQVKR